MSGNLILLSALAKLMEENGIETEPNIYAKQKAIEYDFLNSLEVEKEKFYENIVFEIIKILDNEALEDFECIEHIVFLLEQQGLSGGGRHDFGWLKIINVGSANPSAQLTTE